MLRFEPIAVDVSQGRLSAAPRLRLAPGPMELQLDPGPLVERVTIDPAMCSHALQYIAPVLAGVATAEGQFSIHLDDCRVPLAEPATGDVSGQFVVHAVQIGPGPLIRELAILLGGGSAASLSRESRVRFRMVDGRVYHEGLELVFPDVTVRTHGWVGLDHTLAMVAEMPIPPQWTEKLGASAKAALRDQTLRLPISGTLERPRIDRREFDRLSQRFLQSATRNLLQDELNKQLNRLFNPPRK